MAHALQSADCMPSSLRHARTHLLALSLVAATSAAMLANCSSESEDAEPSMSSDDITGVNNILGLSLLYDQPSGKVRATLKKPLSQGESLYIRVRRGVIRHDSQEKLDCNELSKATPISPDGKPIRVGKFLYEGPSVSPELVKLIELYNDERWYGGHETPEMLAEIAKGPDSIVEACVMKGTKVRARMLTNLAYAWDRGDDLAVQLGASGDDRANAKLNGNTFEPQIGMLAEDGGVLIADAGGGTEEPKLEEGTRYNTIDYAKLCVQELGEIPFFKKLADGKYESFDCRDFVGSNGDSTPAAIDGVEGRTIDLSVDDVPKTECDEGQSSVQTYDCVDKCDRGMWLTASSFTGLGRSAACQPGVTVTTAKNEKGSHWVLLCRKVEATGDLGMMKTKRFNDIAIVGSNPSTGRTCFFQNKENIGNDGSKVVHPADVARSSAIWPAVPSSYCTGNCHAADAFVHSPWIDQAKRGDGHTIVPKMGEHPDFSISDLERPYSLINGKAQGFSVPKQLVSDPVAPCTTCHRVAGKGFAEFSEWATGTGSNYYDKITDTYKAFEKSHWMPPRLDGLSAETFPESSWGKAVAHIRHCSDKPTSNDCKFANIPTKR